MTFAQMQATKSNIQKVKVEIKLTLMVYVWMKINKKFQFELTYKINSGAVKIIKICDETAIVVFKCRGGLENAILNKRIPFILF